jgi:hypothetical protein
MEGAHNPEGREVNDIMRDNAQGGGGGLYLPTAPPPPLTVVMCLSRIGSASPPLQASPRARNDDSECVTSRRRVSYLPIDH